MGTLFIGDVHGCSAELRLLLESAGFDPCSDRLFLTGDAFARGPDPVGVWNTLQETGAHMVLGNHDDRLRRQLDELAAGRQPRVGREHQAQTLAALAPVAGALRPWLTALPLVHSEPAFHLVHAGVNPEAGLAQSTRKELLTIRLWPPAQGVNGPRWHAFYPPGDRLLIFGHDATGGLVRRVTDDGRPYLMGLDSGCVYGFELTGYWLEQDRVVQVACQHPTGYYPFA